MPLRDLAITPSTAPLPADVLQFLQAAGQRIEQFLESPVSLPAFVPSDPARVYRVLEALVTGGHATGKLFCEWGSGFGVVSDLAFMLGLRAHGIEIQPVLVKLARTLTREFDLNVEFVCGTFIPTEWTESIGPCEEMNWLESGGASGYDELCREPDEFDVVFAYPWPGEEATISNLFEGISAEGAILVSYHGREDVRVQRKVA